MVIIVGCWYCRETKDMDSPKLPKKLPAVSRLLSMRFSVKTSVYSMLYSVVLDLGTDTDRGLGCGMQGVRLTVFERVTLPDGVRRVKFIAPPVPPHPRTLPVSYQL